MPNEMIDSLWIVLCSCLVCLMQAGFLCIESGLTRSKNSINVAIKNLSDLGFSVLLFWMIGFGLMYGNSHLGIIGTSDFMPDFSRADLKKASFFLFHTLLCCTAVTILSGAVAERIRFTTYLLATILISTILYPIFGHWAWNGLFNGQAGGWLAKSGFVDFTGSTTIHSLGGWVSLSAILVIGARKGRFSEDGTVTPVPESNLPLTTLGVILLWIGWFGYNCGNVMGLDERIPSIAINTLLAGASGMVTALFIGWVTQLKVRVSLVINGCIAGLVAICASCHAVTTLSAAFIGGMGGIMMMIWRFLLLRSKIDDAVDAIPVHLGAGIWGTLAVGIFGDPEYLRTQLSQGDQLIAQLKGILSCGLWTFSVSYLFFYSLNKLFPLRVHEEAEKVGLNIAEHDARSDLYDLFQTMEQHADTGNLSLRAKVEPFTEIGNIAERYNQVMASLEKAIQENKGLLDKRRQLEVETAGLNAENKQLEKEIQERERSAKEQERMTVEAISSARLASIGELAAGVAHEINNPLNGMINYAQLVMDRIDGKEKEYLEETISEGKRIASIVKNLLDFSRQKEEPSIDADVESIIEDTLRLLESQLRKSGIQVVREIENNLPTLRCRSREIQQVLINLLTNAEHALGERYPGPHKNKIVKLSAKHDVSNSTLVISCIDHGCGIADEYMEQLTKPFYTTKEIGKGTGLGLSISQKLVEKFGGTMKISSILGQETNVRLIFPVSF